jgi:hypothetical protein
MTKRGQVEFLQLDLLFKILIAIFVASIFIMFAFGAGPNKKNEIFLKSDMQMLINSILSSPSKVIVTYTYPKSYDFKADTEKVSVSRDIKIITLERKHSITLQKDSNLGDIKATKNG